MQASFLPCSKSCNTLPQFHVMKTTFCWSATWPWYFIKDFELGKYTKNDMNVSEKSESSSVDLASLLLRGQALSKWKYEGKSAWTIWSQRQKWPQSLLFSSIETDNQTPQVKRSFQAFYSYHCESWKKKKKKKRKLRNNPEFMGTDSATQLWPILWGYSTLESQRKRCYPSTALQAVLGAWNEQMNRGMNSGSLGTVC